MNTQPSPNEYIERNRDAYNAYAKEYRSKLQSKVWTDGDVELVDYLQRYLSPKKTNISLKVLDLGTGNGNVLNLLSARGFDATGIELSPEMASIAKETAPDVPIIIDDFLRHDFAGQKYEGIFACAFVHLFPGDEALRVLQKVVQLLTSKGVALIATTKHDRSEEGYIEKKRFTGNSLHYRRKFTENELRSLITDAGLRVLDYSDMHEDVDSSEDEIWMRFILGLAG